MSPPSNTAAITAPYPHADIADAVARALRRANDPPQPTEDGDRSSLKYAALSQNFRNGAWRHLDEGDLPQASNKAWGVVAETLKAISAEHGGFIHKHRGILEVGWELARLPRNAGDADTASRTTPTLPWPADSTPIFTRTNSPTTSPSTD